MWLKFTKLYRYVTLKNIVLMFLLLIITFAISFFKPRIELRIKQLIVEEVKKINDIENFNLNSLKIGFLPPRVEFTETEVKLRNIKSVKRLVVKKIKVYPELLRLLSFDVKIKGLFIEGLEVEIEDDPTQPPKEIKFSYTDINSIPLSNLYIENSNVKYNKINFDIGFFQIKKRWNRIDIYSDFNSVTNIKDAPEININRLSMEIKENNTKLKQLSIVSKDSNLQIGFEIKKPFNEKILDLSNLESADLRLSSKINLSNFKTVFEKLFKIKVKRLEGMAQVLAFNGLNKNSKEIEVTLEAEDLAFNEFYAEKVSTSGFLSKKKFKSKFLNLTNKNLTLKTENLIVEKNQNNFSISTKGEIKHFELGGFLLENLSLKGVPAYMPAQFNYDCEGLVSPSMNLACSVNGDIKDLIVWSDLKRTDKSIIVQLAPNSFSGKAQIYDSYVDFEAYNDFKNSHVSFKGSVDFIKGFNVAYRSDFFNFSDVKNLANIPLSGFGSITGTSKGSALWGEIDLKADLSNFEFFNYYFGQTISDVRYAKQKIYLNNTKNVINESVVNSEIEFDLKDMTIAVNSESPKASVQDILFAIKKIAEPPVYLSGEGNFKISASGPLNLGQMTYDIKAQFKDGFIFKDRYKNLDLNIVANQGQVKTQSTLDFLGDRINIEGTVDPEGQLDIIAIADSINLSRVNAVKDLGLQISGLSQIQLHLTDFILLPIVEGQFESANLKQDITQLGLTVFDFQIHKNYSEVSGSFFNKSAEGTAKIPHNASGPFEVKMSLSDLDPFKFMTLFDSKISKVGSNTQISGLVDLKASSFEIKKLNGDLNFSKFNIISDKNFLSLKDPTKIKVIDGRPLGVVNFTDNYSNDLKVFFGESENFVKGSLNLGFLRTILPSVEEIQGTAELDAYFSIQPEFKFTKGKGRLENLSLKVENIPHSFRDINTPLTFQDKSIYLNDIIGSFANGNLDGKGRVYFEQSVGVDLSGTVEKINLNIPEDIKTVVSGNYFVKGMGFPYVIGGDFKISEGSFEKEFESEESAKYTILPSQFLPKSKLQSDAVRFDLNVKTLKPMILNNAYLDGSANIDLNVAGSSSLPILKGQVRLVNDSKVIVQDNKFNVNSGVITFNSVAPEDGVLNIDANARIKDFVDILEREYDIRMIVQGTGAKPDITFTSQPSLSESQILSFLALGMLDSNSLNQEISLGDQQTQTGYQIGGIFLKNRFAKDIQDRLGVQLNFTSSYENQDVSPKIVVEKKLSPKFSIQGSRTLGTFQKNTARGEYKINKKLSIIGLYENYDLDNDTSLNRTRLIDGENVFGADFQYNFEFQ